MKKSVFCVRCGRRKNYDGTAKKFHFFRCVICGFTSSVHDSQISGCLKASLPKTAKSSK
ncbi:MAG: hypothetical protein ABFQ53_00905 [Patescibacteria group bacterium]